MESKKIIGRESSGLYYRKEERAIAIRIEECEQILIELIESSARTRQEIKDELTAYFGTDTTTTVSDDNKLFTFIGQILKRLTSDGVLIYDGSKYSIAPEKSAYVKDRQEMLTLKATFLSRLHARGGEYFEHYFMNLIARYYILHGKTVIESKVQGGSDDGGIDGIIKTQDVLGFREVIMVQTKNRSDVSNETDIRSFYGAVCARQGSRGIFATTSGFHPMAEKFLNGIDNCVGVNGEKIFAMAVETEYGIKRDGDRLVIDRDLI